MLFQVVVRVRLAAETPGESVGYLALSKGLQSRFQLPGLKTWPQSVTHCASKCFYSVSRVTQPAGLASIEMFMHHLSTTALLTTLLKRTSLPTRNITPRKY